MAIRAANRLNISNDLCHLLRQRIVDGSLPPGKHINEVHVASELEVSRTPLREALSQLTAEGLIESKPRRGFFAKHLSVEEVKQLYPLRALLDPQALRMAGIPSRERIAELRKINEKIAAASCNPTRSIDLDDKWHRTLLTDCPNEILLDLIEQLIWKTRRYEYAYLANSEHVATATDEHEAILVALEQSDLPRACKYLKQNMTSAREPLIAWLRTNTEKE